MPTLTEFRQRFVEFGAPRAGFTLYAGTGVAETDWQTYLDGWMQAATRLVSVDFYGQRYDDAVYLLMAHMITMASPERGAGVNSVTAGEASVSYGAGVDMLPNDLMATSYGKRFLNLARVHGGARLVL